MNEQRPQLGRPVPVIPVIPPAHALSAECREWLSDRQKTRRFCACRRPASQAQSLYQSKENGGRAAAKETSEGSLPAAASGAHAGQHRLLGNADQGETGVASPGGALEGPVPPRAPSGWPTRLYLLLTLQGQGQGQGGAEALTPGGRNSCPWAGAGISVPICFGKAVAGSQVLGATAP